MKPPQPKTVPVSSSSATAPAQPAPPVQPTQPAQPDHPAAELTPQLATPPPEQPAQPQTATGPGDGFLIGGALEDAVSNIVDMGFPRDQVQRAMRASFNNPDRAVEYLMTVSRFPLVIVRMYGYLSHSLGDPRSYTTRACTTNTGSTASPTTPASATCLRSNPCSTTSPASCSR